MLRPNSHEVRGHRHYRKDRQGRHDGQHRAEQVDHLIHVPWDDLLFEDHLERVGDGLAQPEFPGAVGTIAQRKATHQLALEERQIGEAGEQDHDQDD